MPSARALGHFFGIGLRLDPRRGNKKRSQLLGVDFALTFFHDRRPLCAYLCADAVRSLGQK
jgi:hypothetical protein